jgi:hypothetical protein
MAADAAAVEGVCISPIASELVSVLNIAGQTYPGYKKLDWKLRMVV